MKELRSELVADTKPDIIRLEVPVDKARHANIVTNRRSLAAVIRIAIFDSCDDIVGNGVFKAGAEPGAPYTYVTTPGFLSHFGFQTLRDLPDLEMLEEAGLLSKARLLAENLPTASGEGEGEEEPADEGD